MKLSELLELLEAQHNALSGDPEVKVKQYYDCADLFVDVYGVTTKTTVREDETNTELILEIDS